MVTGASRGIGRAVAKALASPEALVYVNYRSGEAQALAVVAEIEAMGGKAKAIAFDVSDTESVEKAFGSIVAESGGIDVLVNNAGIAIDTLLLRAKDQDWSKTIDVNLKGAFVCTRQALRTMLKRPQGRVINMTSVVGQMGNAGQSMYAASKAGVIGFTKSIAREVASRGVTVNAIAPGFVRTEMTDGLTDDQKQGLLNQIPLRRWAEPEEIASIVKFLASEHAAYITGQVIAANGGMYL